MNTCSRFAAVTAFAAMTLVSMVQAQIFVPATSIDGPGKDAQSMLTSLGIGSNVNSDQISARTFLSVGGPVGMTNLFSVADYAPIHKVGIYQPVGMASTVSFEIGGSNTGLPNGAIINVTGPFGVALQSPDGLFRSEKSLNDDNFDHVAVLRERDSQGHLVDNSYILLFEDLKNGGDMDFNDRAIRLCNVKAVPEPTTMVGIACGLVALYGRRKKRN